MPVLDLSDPKHIRAEERLGSEPIVWLTTVRRDGQPQTSPVWFLWDGEAFLVYSRSGAGKLRNVETNAHVSLHLEGDGLGGDNVIFEGIAELADDAPPADQVRGYIEKYRRRIDQYGWTPKSFAADYPHPIRIRPTRVRIW
jgi:PPOX class probable F420-dependent enzyme